MLTPTLIAVIIAYLIGAIPFGLLIGRLKGVDIRQHGSKNIGATNVGRVVGRKWGFTCLALDILKGLLPAAAFGAAYMPSAPLPADWLAWLGVAVAAVLGHLFPVYLGFRGGKGVATTIGVALGVYPYFTVAILAAVAVYGLLRYATGFVSVGSLGLAVTFPIATAVYTIAIEQHTFADSWPLIAAAVLLSALIIVRHRGNIRRLLKGEEQRVSKSDHAASTQPPQKPQSRET